MSEQTIAIVGIIVGVLMAFIGLLLTIIGWLVNGKLNTIDESTKNTHKAVGELGTEVAFVKTDLIGVKASVEHQGNQQDDLCDRLERVETHVMNTERIAVMEKDIKILGDEIKELRMFRHNVNEKQHEVFVGFSSTIAQVTDHLSKLAERVTSVEKLAKVT